VADIITRGWITGEEKRPEFYEIVKAFLVHEDPLFPDVDMAEYRECRARVYGQTYVAPSHRIYMKQAISTDGDVAELARSKANADTGSNEDEFKVGKMYKEGRGVDRDERAAFEYFRPAADHGHIGAKYEVAVALLLDRGRRTGHGSRVPNGDPRR